MDALLAKIEGAPTGVKLLMVLAEAQDVITSDTGPALVRGAGSKKVDMIACVTAWRDAHDGPEWTQVTAMVFGEVLKAFDAAALVVAAEVAAAEAVAAEAAAAEKAAAEAAEAAAAPIIAAKLVDAKARVVDLENKNAELVKRVEELQQTNTELTDQMVAQEGEREKKSIEFEVENTRLMDQLHELEKTHAASIEAARQGLRQQEAARQATVRRRESEEANAAAAAALAAEQQVEEDEKVAEVTRRALVRRRESEEADAAAAAALAAQFEEEDAAAAAKAAQEAAAAQGLLKVGDRCKVYFEKYSQWYSGTVEEVQINDKQYMVHFDDGERTAHKYDKCRPSLVVGSEQKVIVEVPVGKKAGDSFTVDTGVPSTPRMQVVVPLGCGPGSKLQILVGKVRLGKQDFT